MSEKREKGLQLDRGKAAIDNLYQRGQVDQGTYFKSIIGIAYEWVQLEDLEEARDLISDLTPAYVDEVLLTQMKLDETFHKQAVAVAHALNPDLKIDDGELEIELLLMQKPAAQA